MDGTTATPMAQVPEKGRTTAVHKILTVVGVVLCVVLVPILILNCALLWQTYRHPDTVPKFGSVIPLIAKTDVMYPEIQSGDLVICRLVEPEALEEGDIITFVNGMTPKGISIGINRIAEVTSKDGATVVTVKEMGEEMGEESEESVVRKISTEDIIGVCQRRFPKLGRLILFMQTTQGLILCVILPILLLVGYDVLRTRMGEKRSREETIRLAAELEALRTARSGQAPKG